MPARPKLWAFLVQEQILLPLVARRFRADVTFSPANYGPFLVPRPVIMLRNAVAVGRLEKRITKRLYWWAVHFLSYLSFRTCRSAITVSRHAQEGFRRAFGKAGNGKFTLIPHGVSEAFSAPVEPDRRNDFLLAVSDIYVQKNFDSLLRAMDLLRNREEQVVLRIAGRAIDGGYYQRLLDLRRELRLDELVEFLGEVRVEELVNLYQQCAVFVFPSTVETFGNPLVEAMASGAPIACSRSSAIPEIVGDSALLFDPNDVGDMAEKIAAFLDDAKLRQEMTDRALKRSRLFSWKRTSESTIRLLKQVARNTTPAV